MSMFSIFIKGMVKRKKKVIYENRINSSLIIYNNYYMVFYKKGVTTSRDL